MYDIVIYNGFYFTMEGDGLGVIENGGLAIQDGRIVAMGTAEEMRQAEAKKKIDAARMAVLPGLIDAHVHTGFGLLRGLSQDIGSWMQRGLWPFYDEVTRDCAAIGSRLHILEAMKSGTTTFNDFFGNMADLARNHVAMGTRAIVSEMVNEMLKKLTDNKTGLYTLDPVIGQEKYERAVKLYEDFEGAENGRITVGFGVQATDMLSTELLKKMYDTARSHGKKFMIHVEQGDREIDQMLRRYGKRSIPYLDELGMLDENLLAVHLTETSGEDARRLAERGAVLLHCAGTIGLIDGINPPIGEYLAAGGRVALGSDHTPGNNCSNMFNEMKLTALLNKNKYRDPSVFPAWQMLRLCTIEAARALGMEEEIGSLRTGKKADVILIDLDQPSLAPVITYPFRNIAANLVYSARGSEVRTSIIDGRLVMEDGVVLTVDEKAVVREANEAARELAERGALRVESDSEMLAMYREGKL
ncbi:MAG: amidohydrolase family protein [Oscillospiraceae bacterium]|nr:amidohydrolase family protein [Oscillospiraceae bacterium]